MPQQVQRLSRVLHERPKDARRKIYELLETQDCQSCGQCCRDENEFVFLVLRSEPNFRHIVNTVHGANLQRFEGALRLSFPNSCSLLSSDGRRCSTYDKRPLVCQAFPFVISDGIVCLSSLCPDIQKLKDNGILYINYTDASRPLRDAIKNTEDYPPSIQLRLKALSSLPGSEGRFFGNPFLSRALISIESLVELLWGMGKDIGVLKEEAGGPACFPIY